MPAAKVYNSFLGRAASVPVLQYLYKLFTYIYIHTHTHFFASLCLTSSHSLMVQTSTPKRRSDFPLQRSTSFGTCSGFAQTIRTGNSWSWTCETALASYVVPTLGI